MKSFLEWIDARRFAVIHEPMGHVIKVMNAPDLREALKKLADSLEAYGARRNAVVSVRGEIGTAKLFDQDETRRVPTDSRLLGVRFPNDDTSDWQLKAHATYSVVDLDADHRTPEAREKQAHALKEIEERENRERFEREAKEAAKRRVAKGKDHLSTS